MTTRRARKEAMAEKLKWQLHYQRNPDGPITSAALLQRESDRLRQVAAGGNLHLKMISSRMAWAFALASTWLNSRPDQANLTRYRPILAGDEQKEEAVGSILEYLREQEIGDYRDFVAEGGDPRRHIFYTAAVAGEWGEVLDEAKALIEKYDNNGSTQ